MPPVRRGQKQGPFVNLLALCEPRRRRFLFWSQNYFINSSLTIRIKRISRTSRFFPELSGATNSTIESDQIDYVTFWLNRATEWDSTPKRCSRASSLDVPLL